MTGVTSRRDVVIIGDGPAGSALALACRQRGIDALLIGLDEPWEPTYGIWVDELERVEMLADRDVVASVHPDVVAWTDRRHVLGRAYGVLDNPALKSALRDGITHMSDRVEIVRTAARTLDVELASGPSIECRLVVDATGWPATFASSMHRSRPPAWQTAFGVVLPDPPAGDLGQPTLMDFRSVGRVAPTRRRALRATTFAYSLPVADGWLVEETVLAARPAIEPVALVASLARRLGLTPESMLDRAVRTEYVRIPMGGATPRRDQPIVAFGAAAGSISPISGYSVMHSLQTAPAVADAMASALAARPAEHVADALAVWNAVWPVAARRSRVLHDYGLEMLMRLDDDAVREFFGTFFDLPTATWSAYLRSNATAAEVSATMGRVFRSAPWSTRRRLVAGNPTAFARLVRPS